MIAICHFNLLIFKVNMYYPYFHRKVYVHIFLWWKLIIIHLFPVEDPLRSRNKFKHQNQIFTADSYFFNFQLSFVSLNAVYVSLNKCVIFIASLI